MKVKLPIDKAMGLLMSTGDMPKVPGARPVRAVSAIEVAKASLKDMLAALENEWATRSRRLAVSVETLSVVPGSRCAVRESWMDHSLLNTCVTTSVTGIAASVCHPMKMTVKMPLLFEELSEGRMTRGWQ